ncbi:MAG: hypothetical protein GX348_03170 [Veillonellaceae bacterium]|jgi:hypothetical protein|nr:hypothetical protein [Veillonellaceae bacterium]
MMNNGFFKGLIWGSVVGTILGAIISPMTKPQKKPIAEFNVDAIADTTQGLMRKARYARRRLMKKLD